MVASSLIFASPAWFWALPAIPLAAYGLWKLSVRMTEKRLAKFFSLSSIPHIQASVNWRRKFVRFAATAAILMALAITLTRPLTGPKSEADDRLGADLVIALDVSKSMWVEDVAPNRLEAVKNELSDWITHQKRDRIGLVLFAGKAFVQAPLTHDYTALDFVLRDAGPKSVSKKGSNISEAIETAVHMMKNNKLESKILLLISDGENLEGDAITAARQAHQNDGLTIYAIGVGTSAGGRVPAYDRLKYAPDSPEARAQHGQWVRSQYGAEVISRMDPQALRAIASVGGGSYFEFRPGGSTFPNIRNKNISTLVEGTRKIKTRDYDEWFQIPLAVAMLLIVLEPLLSRTRKKETVQGVGVPVVKPVSYSKPAKVPVATVKVTAITARGVKAALLAAGLFTIAVGPARSEVFSPVDEAEKLFTAGKPDQAVEYLHQQVDKNPTDAYLSYNYALALYRAGRFDEANTIFQSVDALSSDPKLRAQVLFQMGTIALKKGVELHKASPQQNGLGAVRAFEQAMSDYQAQLQIHSSREARENLATTSDQLEGTLLEIGSERTRANTEKTLREALQAYERATELNAKNQPLVDTARKLLSKELERNAAKADEAVDKEEAANPLMNEKTFKPLFEQREQIVAKLEEAVGLAPGDKNLEAALKQQRAEMSNLLTKAAKDQTADAMKAETFFSNRNLKALEDAAGKLDQAISLNTENKAAEKLNGQVKTKLEAAYVANGDLALKHLRKGLESEKADQTAAGKNAADKTEAGKKDSKSKADAQLEDALTASDSYSKALSLAPDNQKAKEGLAEVNGVLADLYSKVGNSDLTKAEEQLGGKLTVPSSAGESKAEDDKAEGDKGEGISTDTKPPSKSDSGEDTESKASPSELRAASATLEKAVQNLSAAAGLKPDDAKFQDDLAKAEALLGAVRAELEKAQGVAATQGKGEGPGEGEGAGGEGAGAGGSGAGKGEGRGKSSLQSMSALRGKGGETGGSEGGESKRYWEKFVQDW